MKNIPSFIIALVITSIPQILLAQNSYVKVNAGYGLSMNAHDLGSNFYDFTNFKSDGTTTSVEIIPISLGKGLTFGGAFGHSFNKNIGAELAVSYLLGDESTAKDEHTSGTTDLAISANMLQITSSLIIQSGREGLNPYIRLGVLLGKGTITYSVKGTESNGNTTTLKAEFDGDLAIGLNAAVGVFYPLGDKMSFFGEINTINMSYAPTKGTVVEATANGVDRLPTATTREKEIELVDKVTDNFLTPGPDNEPSKALKQKLPFGSIGLQVGVRINL